MTMRRKDLVEFFSDVIRFGSIVASRLGKSKSTEVQLDDNPRPNVEVWGHAPLLYKPLAGCETLCIQLGDENICFSTKDRRYQIEVADGEVIVRAIGAATPAYLLLKPGGEAILTTTGFKIGSDGAAQWQVLGSILKTVLEALTVPTAMGPSGTPINAANFSTFLSAKHKIDG